MEEAELLSKSGRTRKKQGKEGVARTYLVSLLSRSLADWGGRSFVIFFQLEHCIVPDIS